MGDRVKVLLLDGIASIDELFARDLITSSNQLKIRPKKFLGIRIG
jgi:hypothetical protein